MLGGAFGFFVPATAVGGGYATWNPADKSASIVLSNSNLTATGALTNSWKTVRATVGKSSGKAVFELTIANDSDTESGFGDGTANLENYLGSSGVGLGFFVTSGTGSFDHSNVTVGGAPNWSGTHMYALDLAAGKGWMKTSAGWANGGDPVAGTTPTFTWTAGTIIYPACSVHNPGVSVTLNAGATTFSNTVPSGYTAGWS